MNSLGSQAILHELLERQFCSLPHPAPHRGQEPNAKNVTCKSSKSVWKNTPPDLGDSCQDATASATPWIPAWVKTRKHTYNSWSCHVWSTNMHKRLVCPKHCNPPSSAPQVEHFECYPGNEPASTSQVRYAHKKIADYSSVACSDWKKNSLETFSPRPLSLFSYKSSTFRGNIRDQSPRGQCLRHVGLTSKRDFWTVPQLHLAIVLKNLKQNLNGLATSQLPGVSRRSSSFDPRPQKAITTQNAMFLAFGFLPRPGRQAAQRLAQTNPRAQHPHLRILSRLNLLHKLKLSLRSHHKQLISINPARLAPLTSSFEVVFRSHFPPSFVLGSTKDSRHSRRWCAHTWIGASFFDLLLEYIQCHHQGSECLHSGLKSSQTSDPLKDLPAEVAADTQSALFAWGGYCLGPETLKMQLTSKRWIYRDSLTNASLWKGKKLFLPANYSELHLV